MASKQSAAEAYAETAEFVEEHVTSALAVQEDSLTNAIDSLRTGAGVYTSMSAASFAERVQTVKAVANAKRLGDLAAGTVIALRHFIVQPVEIVDPQTGEVSAAPRVVLVDDSGDSYASVSTGVLSSLRTLVGIVGQPGEWEEAIPVVMVEEKTRAGRRVNTLKFA